MNYELTAPTLNYVRQHADDDVRKLALRGCKDPDVDLTLALQQIQGRQTARRKLPSWAAIDGIIYPPHLNLEQCSSETTARYKATLCHRLLKSPQSELPDSNAPDCESPGRQSPNSKLLDLTGGFGVDFAFMSQAFAHSTYVERNPQLFAIATANFHTLSLSPVTLNADAASLLRTSGGEGGIFDACSSPSSPPFSLIYLDPARRDVHGQRTYAIGDCTPDVIALLPTLLKNSTYVLLKLSPMLDWRKALADLGPHHVSEIHIVAVNNECKELLFLLQQQAHALTIFCVNDSQTFSFTPATASPLPSSPLPSSPLLSSGPSSVGRDSVAPSSLSPSFFLYEPNAAIMKAGCFAELSARFPLTALAQNSHLFLSPTLLPDFPGRCFRLTAVTTMNKRDLKNTLHAITRANITTRNFPLSATTLRQRLKLTDGGDTYIFATTLADGTHALLVCEKTYRCQAETQEPLAADDSTLKY